MKLIATLGSTLPRYKHKYYIKDEVFESNFSFEALKNYYNVDDGDVIIVGTSQTQSKLGDYIKNYKFVEVPSDDFEKVFNVFIKIIESGDILDLSQSFRSLPMGAFLSYGFSKSLGKEVKNIFYSQVRDNKNAAQESCEFDFISLKKYDDMVELLREINLFLESFQVLKKDLQSDTFKIHNNLVLISDKLYSNNLDIQNEVNEILREINRIKEKESFLKGHLEKLQDDIQKINMILSFKESLKFIGMSEILFNKNMLLQSLTMLFEGILAYLDEKTKKNFKCEKNNKIYTKKDGKYKYRNCLKSKISVVRYKRQIKNHIRRDIAIYNLDEFARHLVKVDELRNNSAHAFINAKTADIFKEDIKREINFFKRVIK